MTHFQQLLHCLTGLGFVERDCFPWNLEPLQYCITDHTDGTVSVSLGNHNGYTQGKQCYFDFKDGVLTGHGVIE